MAKVVITEKINEIDKRISDIECDIDKLKENHLKHIEEEIIKMKTELKFMIEQYNKTQKFMQLIVIIMLSIISGINVLRYIGGM